jgi:hypothetical protein
MKLTDAGNRRVVGDPEQRAALALERSDPRRVRLHCLPLAREAGAEERRQRRAVPAPRGPQMRWELAELGEWHALAGEQALHSIRVPTAIASSKEQPAMHVPPISSTDVGTFTTLHIPFSPPSARMSMVTSVPASSRSVFVRRRRRFTRRLATPRLT